MNLSRTMKKPPSHSCIHKWSCKLEETLSVWPCQAYGPGCSCQPSPTPFSHVTTGLRTVWHLEKTTRLSTKTLGEAGQHEHRAVSFWYLYCDGLISVEGVTRWPVDGQAWRVCHLHFSCHHCQCENFHYGSEMIITQWEVYCSLQAIIKKRAGAVQCRKVVCDEAKWTAASQGNVCFNDEFAVLHQTAD